MNDVIAQRSENDKRVSENWSDDRKKDYPLSRRIVLVELRRYAKR